MRFQEEKDNVTANFGVGDDGKKGLLYGKVNCSRKRVTICVDVSLLIRVRVISGIVRDVLSGHKGLNKGFRLKLPNGVETVGRYFMAEEGRVSV